jgi:hypothetical protein
MSRLIQLLIVAAAVAFVPASYGDPIQDLSMNAYKAGWYPNFYKGSGPLTCPRTCEAWVGAKSESENSFEMDEQTRRTNVCKVTKKEEIIVKGINDPKSHWLYGNQFDDYPVCFVHPIGYEPFESQFYMCQCVESESCNGPDLVVTQIHDPVWDAVNKVSVVQVTVSNIGSAAATTTFVTELKDPGTGASGTQTVAGLAAGGSVTLTFTFSYWVFDPDADLIATVDISQRVQECKEDNNVLEYFKLG